jgi:elongation factor 1-alpha
MQILGFDSNGKVTNYDKFRTLSWEKIAEHSAKLITFIDVGGNNKYASTMINGICSHYPDYALLVVNAHDG